jgi:hypothetical protein
MQARIQRPPVLKSSLVQRHVTYATAIRNMPAVSADPNLNRLLIAYWEEALSRRKPSKDSFHASIEIAIFPLLPHGKRERWTPIYDYGHAHDGNGSRCIRPVPKASILGALGEITCTCSGHRPHRQQLGRNASEPRLVGLVRSLPPGPDLPSR